jgi:hypothetical protein
LEEFLLALRRKGVERAGVMEVEGDFLVSRGKLDDR